MAIGRAGGLHKLHQDLLRADAHGFLSFLVFFELREFCDLLSNFKDSRNRGAWRDKRLRGAPFTLLPVIRRDAEPEPERAGKVLLRREPVPVRNRPEGEA